VRKVFDNLAISNWRFAIGQTRSKSGRKKSFDKAVIRQLNGTLVFVCNRTSYPRVGCSAERVRLRGTKRSGDRDIWSSGDRKTQLHPSMKWGGVA
jgi:hypothetical protein